ncbi:MAG TPA: hypothetical protein GX506_10490 [Firmicutes bacterium]|nr:hypothetical protein [Bacillota bacterium]
MVTRLTILGNEEIKKIHDTSIRILSRVGMRFPHEEILRRFAEAGARVDWSTHIVKIHEDLVWNSIGSAQKQFMLYGRNPSKIARFGYGDSVFISSAGEYGWIDSATRKRREPTEEDVDIAIAVGDVLENINIVGPMGIPPEIPCAYRDVYLTAKLVKGTGKPSMVWIRNGKSALYVLAIYEAVAGGTEQHRLRPMTIAHVEPVSPLQMTQSSLEIMLEFAKKGLPVIIAPMTMVTATGPGTLAGTMALTNAEILGGIVAAQLIRPGTPVVYGGIPHIMDPATTLCSFGAPEQAIMAVCMTQLGKFYGFPVYVDTGMTDSKVVDAQSGLEKGMTLLFSLLAGADAYGHMGHNADQGANLCQLIVDNEMVTYVRQILRKPIVDDETLAFSVIEKVGPGGHFLVEDHTLGHFREEIWLPKSIWDRHNWVTWENRGSKTMDERASEILADILKAHKVEPLDEGVWNEIDGILEDAKLNLV